MSKTFFFLICLILILSSESFAKRRALSSKKNRRSGLILGLGASVGQHVPYTGDFDKHSGGSANLRLGWAFGPSVSISFESVGVTKVSKVMSTTQGVTTTTEEVRMAGGGMFNVRLYPLSFIYVEGGGGGVIVSEEKEVDGVNQYKKEATGDAWSAGTGIEFFVGEEFDIALALGFKYIAYRTNAATQTTIDEPLANDIEKPRGRIAMGVAMFTWYF